MILGICGSPRDQTTNYVLNIALSKLKNNSFKTIDFEVRGKDIHPCQHCDYCLKNKKCIIEDDMQELYPLIEEAEGFIIATPIHCGGISSQIKMIMERCRALEAKDLKILSGKTGMGIAVGGDRVGGQELAIQEINTFYIIHNINIVGGGSFGANLGASFWSKDSLEEIKKDKYGFETLNRTINNFMNSLKKS